MSNHRSESPHRVEILPGMDGHSTVTPPRLIVSPSMQAELQRVSPHSMLLAQLTPPECSHRTTGAVSPNAMGFSMGSMPVLGQQSAFSVAQTALMGGTLQPQTLFPIHSAGVPALVGSGLVSLPPGCAPGPVGRSPPQPSQIHIYPDSDVTPSQYQTVPVTLRVPSPASQVRMKSPNHSSNGDNGHLSVSPASSSRSISPFVMQQLGNIGPARQSSPVDIHRVSPNPMHRISPIPQNRVLLSSNTGRVLSNPSHMTSLGPSVKHISPSSGHAAIRNALHRNVPVVTVQKSTPTGVARHPNTLQAPNCNQTTMPLQRVSPLLIVTADHRSAPVTKISPKHNRVSTVQQRSSPVQHKKALSGEPRSSPVQHSNFPVQHRSSPVHRDRKPVVTHQDSLRHSASPVHKGKAVCAHHVKSSVPSSIPHDGQPVLSDRTLACSMPSEQYSVSSVPHMHLPSSSPEADASTVISVCKPVMYGQNPAHLHQQADWLSSSENPFAAAMTAAKTVPSQNVITKHPAATSSTSMSHQLFNLLVMNKPKPVSDTEKVINAIKQEKADEPPIICKPSVSELRTIQHSFIATPIPTKSYSTQVRDSQHPSTLSKQVTSLVHSSSQDKKDNPPPLMPLLSNIMGLLPLSTADLSLTAQDIKTDHSTNLGLEAMPRLMPEATVLANHISANKLLFTDQIKEEVEDGKWTSRENPFCLRLKNLNNFPSTTNHNYRPTYRSQGMAIHRAKTGCVMNTARSLDLLRHNLQKFINQEIDQVVQKYIADYFRPGIENMRQNNGGSSVSDDHMQAVCQQILEEAKKMYMSGSRCSTPDPNDDGLETGSLAPPENKNIREKKLDLFRIKKRRGSSDSEASVSKKPKRRSRLHFKIGSGRATPQKQSKHEAVKKEGPKWDPERLMAGAQFIMGAKANKALGLGAQRGRLYIKHPELFKYAGDQEDKNWLHDNHHMPATGGKAYLLLVEDILAVAATDEYKDNPGLMLNEVVGFTVPDWMREKMKGLMRVLRTDLPKSTSKAKSPTQVPITDDMETIPFSSIKSSSMLDIKSDIQPSPSTTENMDVASTDQDIDDPSSMSPLNMTGVFTDIGHSPEVSPAPSADHDYRRIDEEPPLTAPFDMG